MENIQLNNGQSVLIGSNRDIIEAVQEFAATNLQALYQAK